MDEATQVAAQKTLVDAGLLAARMELPIADEAAFYSAWRVACDDDLAASTADAWRLAVLGGALADRLAWVFISGYQAALRCCFELPAGWSALAVSEAKDDISRPGVELDGDRLSGWKTWVAGVASVDSLVVSAGNPSPGQNRTSLALVPRDAVGLTLHVPETTPGFLSELSQGQAELRSTTPERWVDEAALARFRTAESCGVVVALCSMLWHRLGLEQARDSVLAAAEHRLLGADEPDRAARKSFQTSVAQWVRELPEQLTTKIPDFERDQRLLAMMLPALRPTD